MFALAFAFSFPGIARVLSSSYALPVTHVQDIILRHAALVSFVFI
jgi:hypothetical protein